MQPISPPLKHLIVDRDGVLNSEAEGGWVLRADDWQWLDGSLQALQQLTELGLRLSVATNQSCVGRGLAQRENIDAVHHRMRQETEAAGGCLAAVYTCPHAPDDGCECRKPRSGLLRLAVADSGIAVAHSAFVGDAGRDLEAARGLGMASILVRTGKGRQSEQQCPAGQPVFDDLLAVAQCLARGQDPRQPVEESQR